MHIFYVPEISEEFCVLGEDESRHCQKVLRLKPGDPIKLTDGKGNLYDAMIEGYDKKFTRIRIVTLYKEFQKRLFHLHIAIAPTKNIDRFEWFLEKSTEIGIDEITPIITDHAERKTVNMDRLDRIIISAMKQSVKAYKPKLNNIQTLNDLLAIERSGTQKFIAHCFNNGQCMLKDLFQPGAGAIILIGPEGDFSLTEVQQAENFGYKSISLSQSRLRTETAGLVACHTINLLSD
jgi:16S rRNA (uracil1498-N3)-methyltransferase